MESKDVKTYRSNYEFTCDKCKQPIKPQTPYRYEKYYTDYKGKRVTALWRFHVKCPDRD